MNKEKKIRSLTWKYFWKRKREEVWKFFKDYLICFMLMIALILLTMSLVYPDLFEICFIIIYGSMLIAMLGLIIYCFYLCIETFIEWLRSNWRLATRDAIQELKKGRRNKR